MRAIGRDVEKMKKVLSRQINAYSGVYICRTRSFTWFVSLLLDPSKNYWQRSNLLVPREILFVRGGCSVYDIGSPYDTYNSKTEEKHEKTCMPEVTNARIIMGD